MVYNVRLLFILFLSKSFSTYFVDSSRQRYFERDTDYVEDTYCPCGTNTYRSMLIMDGEDVTDFRKYPWIVSLHKVKEGKILGSGCGGTIISPYYILTAAHCIKLMADNFKIGLKGGDITKPAKYLEVENHIVHPKYEKINDRSPVHDVALIKTKTPIPCTDFNRPACLPKKDVFRVDDELIVVGWGDNWAVEGEMGHPTDYIIIGEPNEDIVLREGTVKVIDIRVCQKLAEEAERPTVDEKIVFCAFGHPSRVCHGDSGGPLLAEHDGRFYVVGINSYGFSPACGREPPQVFMNAARHYSFISKHVKDLPDV